MQDRVPAEGHESPAGTGSTEVAEQMLRAVLDGETYDAVATRYGITRTGVERRIKALAARAVAVVGVDGINEDGAAFVRRLRDRREAVLAALDALRLESASAPVVPREIRILSEEEVASGARRVQARSPQPLEDLALYYLLFATGARPLEVARLQVRDYLAPDGNVRRASEIRAEVAINGRWRPLYFRSARLDEALERYLAQRVQRTQSVAPGVQYRGLDPSRPLFLSPSGRGFEITPYGSEGQRRYRCRAIQETYRKLWRYAEFKQVTALALRHTVADRLYQRGADEDQVGLLLGISERSAVREMFPRRLPRLDQLTDDLV